MSEFTIPVVIILEDSEQVVLSENVEEVHYLNVAEVPIETYKRLVALEKLGCDIAKQALDLIDSEEVS